MKPFRLLFVLAMTMPAMAQSPVRETLAYSRSIISGIPGDEHGAGATQNPLPTSYFIYIVIRRGTAVSLTDVCVQGKSYRATLKRVESPVTVEHDPSVPTGKKDTLVGKTSDDVYQVEIGEKTASNCKTHGEDKVSQRSEVVVFLKSGEASWYGLAEKIVALHPAHAM